MPHYHTPVLLEESVSALVQDPSGTYADATFGGGGHTAALLARLTPAGRVLAFDRDSDALANLPDDPRLTPVHGNFRFIENYAKFHGISGFDGILADLGVSSHQFDTAARGFSFRFDAPLDMRMGRESPVTAADIVSERTEEDLARILRLYGEVDNAGRMARLIVQARGRNGLRTTAALNDALRPALPPSAEHKVLAKVYQALRIEVNGELRALEKFLEGAAAVLRPGGRLAVITYHSLEDRMVKNFIRTGRTDGTVEKDAYGRTSAPLQAVTRHPVTPSEAEIASNTRARSAKLRVARKGEDAR